MIFGNHLGCLECVQNITRNICPNHVMSEESCAICRAFNRQLRVPRSPHCITKKGQTAQNTARPMTYACPHISEKWRDQEVVTSISEITDDVNCCQVVPSYTFASNRKKPIQSMELNHNLLSIMLFSSHLQPQNLSSTETSPRPGGCDGRPISIMLQDDGMTFRVWREHEDGLFSCTIKRA